MNDFEFGWVVGMIEGEGSFYLNNPSKNPSIVIGITSTDEDVILRLQEYTGIGRVYGPYKGKAENHRQTWQWVVAKRADAEALSEAIMPYLGERRKERLLEQLGKCLMPIYSTKISDFRP